MPQWYREGLTHVWQPYTQMKSAPPPCAVARTSGSRIWLSDGRELIDGIASWWTACHGYNHPHIRRAVAAQIEVMPHIMLGGTAHEQASRLAARLAKLLPDDLDHVFFSESGSVAIEVAMKMAVQYWLNRGEPTRTKFVSFNNGYHGDTTGAMSISDPTEGMHAVFAGLIPRQFVVDLPTNDERDAALVDLIERHVSEIAGIVVEPSVQGAGGMKFHSVSILRRLRDIASRFDLLLVFDEIFTGFGRTGAMFACQAAGVTPDIITLSKALTGGTLPLAATVARQKVFDAFLSDEPQKALMHGPTFMGNALACAAANASLDLFEREPRLDQVAAVETALRQGLEPCHNFPHVKDVRVRGAIGVVEFDRLDNLDELRARFIDEGVFIRPFGNIIYLTPAFTISSDELTTLTHAIVRVGSTP